MSDAYYPPPAFYFALTVLERPPAKIRRTEIDASFQEISGIQADFKIDEQPEGGENRFVHRLPVHTTYQNLVLKRGVVTKDSFLAEWVAKTVGSNLASPIEPQNLLVTLLNESGAPAMAWSFANAYPVKSSLSALNSQDDKILIETLELAYNYFNRVSTGGGRSVGIKVKALTSGLEKI